MDLRDADWSLWRSFLAAVQEGSLSGAARKLGATQPTVGRHIDALEAALGVPLFVRAQRGLTPTAAALDLLPHAQAMDAAAAALVRTASGEVGGEEGTVRLTTSHTVGTWVAPGMIRDFRDAHPGIDVELVLSDENKDLLKREADIAIRMVRPQQGALVARKIADSPVGLFARQDYLARHGTPRTLDDLQRHTLIGPESNTWGLQRLREMGVAVGRESFSIRADSEIAQQSLVRAGAGIGGIQLRIAEKTPELVRVLPDLVEIPLEVWLVMHEDLRASRRVRLLYDHLAGALTAYLRPPRAAA